tara:strand:- start:318 stop:578 length:261 start_codon:yes stop_codon:yes gene_type:complete
VRKWRSASGKYFATRGITKKELPKLMAAMKEDGLIAMITYDGVKWYLGDYALRSTSVAEVWGLTSNQMRRIHDYIVSNDPFMELYE